MLKLLRPKPVKGVDPGAKFVTVAIRNPVHPELVWDGEFLIDTGAMNSLVPRQYLESIGLAPKSRRSYRMADGSEIVADVAGARIEVWGEVTWGTVIFGAEDALPRLGVAAMQSVGIEVYPRKGLSDVYLRGGSGFPLSRE